MAGRPVAGLSWAEALLDPIVGPALAGQNEAEWERDRILREFYASKFHFHGHRTEQEAIDCYQQFLKDFGETEPI
jgi:ADP-heptose:LPS heptosyltransferase